MYIMLTIETKAPSYLSQCLQVIWVRGWSAQSPLRIHVTHDNVVQAIHGADALFSPYQQSALLQTVLCASAQC